MIKNGHLIYATEILPIVTLPEEIMWSSQLVVLCAGAQIGKSINWQKHVINSKIIVSNKIIQS